MPLIKYWALFGAIAIALTAPVSAQPQGREQTPLQDAAPAPGPPGSEPAAALGCAVDGCAPAPAPALPAPPAAIRNRGPGADRSVGDFAPAGAGGRNVWHERAGQFIWGSFFDTDIAVESFFGADHTVMARFMAQYELSYEAPIVVAGSGPSLVAVSTEAICATNTLMFSARRRVLEEVRCPQLAAGVSLRLGTTKFTYRIPHPVPYVDGLVFERRAPVPSLPVWRRLFLIRRGNLIEVWLDGEHLCRIGPPSTACDAPVGALAPLGRLQLGRRAGAGEPIAQFYGLIDDVAVFDHALDAAEITAWSTRTAGLNGADSGVRAWIDFNFAAADPRIHAVLSSSTSSGRVVNVSAAHDSAADAARLPIAAGTDPIDIPFAAGETWEVIQQFAVRGSHAGPAAFSWDFVFVPDSHQPGSPQGQGTDSDSIGFLAGGGGHVVFVDVSHPNPSCPSDCAPNILDVQHKSDEIHQYLHQRRGSTSLAVGDAVVRGQRLGIVSNVGGGTQHLHFAVVDRADGIGVTRPAYFANYCVSSDFGVSWMLTAIGMPTNGQWVRRPTAGGSCSP